MITISLCMIVKNEEDTLERCIDSVKDIVDEIIIVDTGSTDKTREIAARLTENVYDFEWINSFSAARNFSYSKATMEYILILDADDVLLEEDRDRFRKLKETLRPEVDVVLMPYNVGFDTAGNVTLSYYRERLSKREKNFQWIEPVHEHLSYSGNILYSDVCITHKKIHPTEAGRNLRIYEGLVAEGKELSPRGQYYFARELFYNGRFEESIKYFEDFLEGKRGWIEDNIRACLMLAKCKAALKDQTGRLHALLRSFEYDTPRAEACCDIGYYFKEQRDYNRARFWFELALKLEKPKGNMGFNMVDYWGYIPCMELCACYDKLGMLDEAIKYHKMAKEFKPDDPAVLYNEEYFNRVTKQK
ncbi:MAG: tetratricopeptide repeat-containing glycosyltransferase family 2 protein [Bacillota bacterium]